MTRRNQWDHRGRGGQPRGYLKAGPIQLRLALTVKGARPMSFLDANGLVATIERGPGRGVAFVDGAHTVQRGVVKHRNDDGGESGVTLIITFRADTSSAFKDLSPAERLFAHTGLAVF